MVEGEGLIVLPGLRRPARPPAHARARGRGGPRVGHPRGGRRRLLPRSSRCRTPIRSWTRRRCCARCRSAPRARRSCRSASSPRSRRACRGTELTEMVELAREGAAGFSDDGFPVVDAHRMRQALQYQRLAGGVLALHEEDPALSGDGAMHEGAVSMVLGLTGIPSISESTMIERDAEIARYEDGRHPHPAPLRGRVGRGDRAAPGPRACGSRPRSRRTTWCSPTRPSRSLDPRFKMNPPLAGTARPRGADRGPALRRDRLRRDRPRSPFPRGEGGAVRGGADGRHRPRDRLRGPLHGPRAARRAAASSCWSSA